MKLSGLRDDSKVVKLLTKGVGNKKAAYFMKLPLFVIPVHDVDIDYKRFMKERIIHDEKLLSTTYAFEHFADEFVALLNMDFAPVAPGMAPMTFYVHFERLGKENVAIDLYATHPNNKYVKYEFLLKYKNGGWSGQSEARYSEESLRNAGLHNGQQKQLTIAWVLQALVGFHKYAFEHDMYLTLLTSAKKQTPHEKHTASKKPWLTRRAPRLVFLNELPDAIPDTERAEPKGGSHASPIQHRRKGHWMTLSADCFKNHPMYKVHKGVWRRAALVGKLEVEVEGTQFKILMESDRGYSKVLEADVQPADRAAQKQLVEDEVALSNSKIFL
ncbi:MAG: hypothetical protein DRH08_15715 [Deltaproteobacteria bacterium]|nr:MAG: hypothetical protein DRH08_15715 [Deltaproteobacteria bacterium]